MKNNCLNLMVGVLIFFILLFLTSTTSSKSEITRNTASLSANLEWNKTWDTPVKEMAVAGDEYINGPVAVIDAFNDSNWKTENITILRYNSLGNVIWNKTWDKNGINDGASPKSLKVDSSNNIWIVGEINGTNPDNEDAVLLSYNQSGNLTKCKIWNFNNQDCLTDLAINNNSLFVVGWTNGTSSGWTDEGLLLKIDMNGNILNKTIIKRGENTIFTSIFIKNDSVFITGYINETSADIITLKFDTNCNLVWNKIWNSGNSDWAKTIVIDKNNIIYIGGMSADNTILLKYNWAGTFISSQNLGKGNHAHVKIDSNGNILIGWTANLWASVSLKAIDTSGSEIWNTNWKDTGYMVGINDIIPTKNGTFYVLGSEGKSMGAERAIILKYSQTNVPEYSTVILPITITIALFVVILRKTKRRES